MRRILVIGPCGAGKSTFATALSQRLGLPLFHMDQLNWRPGWIESSDAELRTRLSTVTAQEAWIIDGTYGGTLDARLPRADTVLYLDYPISLCIRRLLTRVWTYHGRSRPDMPDGCPERLDLAFLWYVVRWNSGPRLRTEARLRGHEGKVQRFREPAALDAWLQTLPMRATDGSAAA